MLATVRNASALAVMMLVGCQRASPPVATDSAVQSVIAKPAPLERVSGDASGRAAPALPKPTTVLAKQATPPPHACVVRSDSDLGPGERVLVAAHGTEGRIVVVGEGGRTLTSYELVGSALSPLSSHTLSDRVQRASLVCDRECELAFVDDRANLLGFTLERDRLRARGVLASGADRRFAPALAQRGARTLYAYTSSVDEAMHTFLVTRANDEVAAPRDLTPPGHGAAAPAFILGEAGLSLVVIDARAGVSPLLEIPFDDRAEPAPAIVRTPVSQPYAPPLLRALAWPDGKIEVYYTVVGRMAMTAVGRVLLRTPNEPTPLQPSRGYGELSFATALASGFALFALEVPNRADGGVNRSLELKLADGANTYDSLTIEGALPSLATLSDTFLLGYRREDRVHVASLACAR